MRAPWEPELEATVPGKRDDKVDAFMAAWVASLSGRQRRAFGDTADFNDSIWGPA